ncbi:MAG: hypothetical protein F4023_09170 [Acidobacteria bacterium]|nr:hypothetical protein [Acidobacteriota bacterium]MYI38510.1 hypothetical protein [Acidobacteriota bacterium]MYK79806.1 hypothetical protein [Acidobacteriota bacterium]
MRTLTRPVGDRRGHHHRERHRGNVLDPEQGIVQDVAPEDLGHGDPEQHRERDAAQERGRHRQTAAKRFSASESVPVLLEDGHCQR